jgi:hypothetical protein
MLWLQPIPWSRWAAAAVIAAIALWVEVGPEPTVSHPFAIADIGRGETLTPDRIEMRTVPAGLLEPPGPGTVAVRDIPSGAPLVRGDTGEEGRIVPAGWWVVATEVPPGATKGDPVRVVLLDEGGLVEGVVAGTESEDPFQIGRGAVAVPPGSAESVARAAAGGRLVVLVGTG